MKLATSDWLSVAVFSATAPPAALQVASTARGMKCSRLNELSVWMVASPAGHPDDWETKESGKMAVLAVESGGPLPTSFPVPSSSVTSRTQGSAPLSQKKPGPSPFELRMSWDGSGESPDPAGSEKTGRETLVRLLCDGSTAIGTWAGVQVFASQTPLRHQGSVGSVETAGEAEQMATRIESPEGTLVAET